MHSNFFSAFIVFCLSAVILYTNINNIYPHPFYAQNSNALNSISQNAIKSISYGYCSASNFTLVS